MITTSDPVAAGPARFARFALPPHELGFCGPTEPSALGEYLTGGCDRELREMARTFEGAYPYLELLAGAAGVGDPLDPRVVEAYWIGNDLLDRVDPFEFGRSIDDRFRRRAGAGWEQLRDAVPAGVPHHAFHVLRVMPWAGLLRDGVVDEPLGIVDRCRISWATVTGFVEPDDRSSGVLIRRLPLTWEGSRLVYGPPVVEQVRSTVAVDVGDAVAVHWDWICERIDATQLRWLRTVTDRQLRRIDVP